jgi:hypothetical protein
VSADDHAGPLAGLLEAAHLAVPDEVPGLVDAQARHLGAYDTNVLLVDVEQESLHPLPRRDGEVHEPVAIDGTIAGRCFQLIRVERSATPDGELVWVPLVDGTERLGVLELAFRPGDADAVIDDLRDLAGLAAEVVMTKTSYGDFFHKARRTRPMSPSAELLWRQLPPLTFATAEMSIAALLAPPYEVGGDAFDYGVGRSTAHVAILDAMGHGLGAGLLATIALAAHRNSRRLDADLPTAVAAIDRTIAAEYDDCSFVTGVFARLDIASGTFHYSVAGHPRPLLLRGGRIVRELDAAANGGPLGLGTGKWPAAVEQLEPGDRVLMYTDGVVEARDVSGAFFGDERLAEFIVEASRAGAPPPETLRQLFRAILAHQAGALQDDATVLIVEWRGPGSEQLSLYAAEEHEA